MQEATFDALKLCYQYHLDYMFYTLPQHQNIDPLIIVIIIRFR